MVCNEASFGEYCPYLLGRHDLNDKGILSKCSKAQVPDVAGNDQVRSAPECGTSPLDMGEKCPLANSDTGNFREVDTISWSPHGHSISQAMVESPDAVWVVSTKLQLALPEQARKRGVRLQRPNSEICVLNGNSGSPKGGNSYGDGVSIVVNRGNARPLSGSFQPSALISLRYST